MCGGGHMQKEVSGVSGVSGVSAACGNILPSAEILNFVRLTNFCPPNFIHFLQVCGGETLIEPPLLL